MKQRLPTLLLSSLLLATSLNASADNVSGLTAEQIQHEKRLTELRKQREVLEIMHSQAKMLRECNEMGIDCRSGSLEVIEQNDQDFNEEISRIIAEEQSFALPKATGTSSDASTPKLTAIQNASAQLTHSGSSHWALVGDKVGPWQVVHIDASKVRIKHTGNAKTQTLVLNW